MFKISNSENVCIRDSMHHLQSILFVQKSTHKFSHSILANKTIEQGTFIWRDQLDLYLIKHTYDREECLGYFLSSFWSSRRTVLLLQKRIALKIGNPGVELPSPSVTYEKGTSHPARIGGDAISPRIRNKSEKKPKSSDGEAEGKWRNQKALRRREANRILRWCQAPFLTIG